MAKLSIITEGGRLRGAFTQKKKLWETMGFEEKAKDLMLALNEEKFSALNYSKLCKYIKERGILQIYHADNIVEGDKPADVPKEYIIWELETNEYYDPELPMEDEEEKEEWPDCENCGHPAHPNIPCEEAAALNGEVDITGVHRTHCCKEHGCKYMEEDCPVVNGIIPAEHPCEECEMERDIVGEGEKSREKFHI